MSAARVGTATGATADRPETPAQVSEHERFVKRYRAAGLCTPCAAQAGYGHQLGYRKVHAPCAACISVVASFPLPRANGWRAMDVRGRRRAPEVGTGSSRTRTAQMPLCPATEPREPWGEGVAA